MGEHLVSIKKNGNHVANSPVSIMVVQSEIGDASRAKVYGRGLSEGRTFEMSDFIVDTRDAGYGGISLAVEGPSKVDIQTEDLEDGTCKVSYFPTVPGVYIVSTKFADEHVPGMGPHCPPSVMLGVLVNAIHVSVSRLLTGSLLVSQEAHSL